MLITRMFLVFSQTDWRKTAESGIWVKLFRRERQLCMEFIDEGTKMETSLRKKDNFRIDFRTGFLLF